MFKFVIIGFLLVAVAHSVPVPVPQDYDYSINHNGDVKPAGFRPHASSNPSSPYGPGEPRQYQDYSEEGSDTAPDYYGNDYGAGVGPTTTIMQCNRTQWSSPRSRSWT
ncbi:hypothetical protein TCAL_15609 [Tigriopus californicus]|uniref:Uncharacterized protein n=1 Tax=Tigriopus californicus TaxID=6832 RepID=A0A553PCC0_TIGCA|nr:uncharacterized protein LOC131893056 [Tigriopus californicus]TRY75336.1 hypothetical protein TCAL_15609 [Tigriopus californicus]